MPQFHSNEATVAANSLDVFTSAYIMAIYFTDTGDTDQPGSEAPLEPQARETIIRECREWQEQNAALLSEAYAREGYTAERAGHDFWLTRTGHGAGFWDREELRTDGLGDRLSDAARAAGDRWINETDAGMVDYA